MRILIISSLIIGLLFSYSAQANNSPAELTAIINAFKSGESIIDKKIILEDIHFADLDSKLTPANKNQLTQLANTLKQIPTVTFEIISHTDKQSEKASGRQLTRLRAKNVSDFLILQGIPYQRVFYTGMGDKSPISKSKKEAGRALNNRIELRFVGLKKGDHQIITRSGEPVSAEVVIIDDEQLYYRSANDSRNNTLPLAEVQRVDMTFGKPLKFNAKSIQKDANTARVATNPAPKATPKTSVTTTTKNTKVATTTPSKIKRPATKKQENKIVETPTKSIKKTAKKPKKKANIASTSTATKDVVTPSKTTNKTPQKSSPSAPNQTKIDKEALAKTNNNDHRSADKPKSIVRPSTTTPSTTTSESPNVVTTTPNTPRVGQMPQQPTIETPANTTNKNEQKSESSPINTDSTVETSTNNIPSSAPNAIAVESILSLYLDNYLLQPKERPKTAPTSEELFNLNRSNTGLSTSIAGQSGQVNSLVGGNSSAAPTTVAQSKGGFTFQIVRQPLGVEAATLRLNYVDNSAQAIRVDTRKDLPESSNLLMGSLGFIFHSDTPLSYQLNYNFGSKEDISYNALGLGVAYRLAMGKLQLLPGAQLEYGSGNFLLTTHQLATNIFTVKNTEFISESVDIRYRENLASVTPQLGITYPINSNFDILLNGGYSFNIWSISKLRFNGGTENSESRTVREKLDAANFSINGTTVVESAKLFGLRGLTIKAGAIYKFY